MTLQNRNRNSKHVQQKETQARNAKETACAAITHYHTALGFLAPSWKFCSRSFQCSTARTHLHTPRAEYNRKKESQSCKVWKYTKNGIDRIKANTFFFLAHRTECKRVMAETYASYVRVSKTQHIPDSLQVSVLKTPIKKRCQTAHVISTQLWLRLKDQPMKPEEQ